MTQSVRVLVALPAVFTAFLAGCTSARTPPPVVDPTKERIVILQKQLLELQNAQNETRRIVDEQAAIISSLTSRIKDAEDRQALSSSPQINPKQTANSQSKKPGKSKGKKRKPVRRQEQ